MEGDRRLVRHVDTLLTPLSICQYFAYSGGVEEHPAVVGTVEIARRLNVSRSAVDQWRARGLGFPQPRWIVGGRPAWDWAEIEKWAKKTDRL